MKNDTPGPLSCLRRQALMMITWQFKDLAITRKKQTYRENPSLHHQIVRHFTAANDDNICRRPGA